MKRPELIIQNKKCSNCKIDKEANLFYKTAYKLNKTGLTSWCKLCTDTRGKAKYNSNKEHYIKKSRDWRKKNLEKSLAIERRSKLKKNFGITEEQYKFLLDTQRGVCAICETEETTLDPRTGRIFMLAVDHCHKTNIVRGLLCRGCNVGIGNLKDSITLLQKAIKYLEALC